MKFLHYFLDSRNMCVNAEGEGERTAQNVCWKYTNPSVFSPILILIKTKKEALENNFFYLLHS